jgi:Xaa-Pro aminopeptidase
MPHPHPARLFAGLPDRNLTLYHQIRFRVGDPTVLIELPLASGETERLLLIRDIEMERARAHARADRVVCATDFVPEGGLSGDRETATAQATSEILRRAGITSVIADRTLPLLYAHVLLGAGITVTCDPDLGVTERRSKDEQELAWLREAQGVTERVMRRACETVADAKANSQGVLHHDGSPLTSERLRTMIDLWLLELGYANPDSIVACGPIGADCHHHGAGDLKTEQPVIVDIFPCNKRTLYNGDCTRTVVHGQVPPEVAKMHRAVVEAKAAAIGATRAGQTGRQVHDATTRVIVAHGYSTGLPGPDAPSSFCSMVHGTGHGIGLEVHEPPILDGRGPALVEGDVVTIEPGLYCRDIGGVRVEDMVQVTDGDAINFNALPEGLDWRTT